MVRSSRGLEYCVSIEPFPSGGKMVLFEESIDLGEQITGAMRFVAERARQDQIALEREIAPGLPPLFADQRSVRSPEPALQCDQVHAGRRPDLGAGTAHAGGGLELMVADTGIGMSPEHLAVALTPFGQVANEYTRRHDATGLGLPLVKSLEELHGACMEIESALGRGTIVRIAFPSERVLEPRELQVAV